MVESDGGGVRGGDPQSNACHSKVRDVAGCCRAIQRDHRTVDLLLEM